MAAGITIGKPYTLHVLWNSNELARLYMFVRLIAILTKRMDTQGNNDHPII